MAARLFLLKLPHTFASQLDLAPNLDLGAKPGDQLAPPPQKQRPAAPPLRTSPSAGLASVSLAADAAPPPVAPAVVVSDPALSAAHAASLHAHALHHRVLHACLTLTLTLALTLTLTQTQTVTLTLTSHLSPYPSSSLSP